MCVFFGGEKNQFRFLFACFVAHLILQYDWLLLDFVSFVSFVLFVVVVRDRLKWNNEQ